MNTRRLVLFLLLTASVITLAAIPQNYQNIESIAASVGLVAGRNVNMVSGTDLLTGDPYLQRQNEPSIAVSTRNPMVLFAACNDYRTVDADLVYEEVPGHEVFGSAPDAFIGVYSSDDGGASWISTVHPGFDGFDTTPPGKGPNPLIGYPAAADPVVRAGPNGLFYVAGIVFDRLNNRGAVFVSRWIDNNDDETGPNITYIDTQIIDSVPAGDIFIDKPWIAVDIPRRPLRTTFVEGQQMYRHNVYISYTVFDMGGSALESEIKVARSTDCGNSWQSPVQAASKTFTPAELSGDEANIEAIMEKGIYQGSTIAIGPIAGVVYVAWRSFDPNAIYITKSYTRGWGFRPPKKIANINPFDQPTKSTTDTSEINELGAIFRTNSYPTMAVDHWGRVYVAWSERILPGDKSRIMMSTSLGDFFWTSKMAVENTSSLAHQFMPSLTYAHGKLMLIWYDQLMDIANCFPYYIIENCPIRHTIDVRAAYASPERKPNFSPSIQVSKYEWELQPGGGLVRKDFNFSNLTIYANKTVPFNGDYIDVTSQMFVPREKNKPWKLPWEYNNKPTKDWVFHAAWTDARDVDITGDPNVGNLENYNPPGSNCTMPNQTGVRNHNIYTSRLTQGIIAYSPTNSKQLNMQRAFVVFVQNVTEFNKYFKLTITPPQAGTASFDQFDPFVHEQSVFVDPFSSIATTVFVESSDPRDSATVRVTEVNSSGNAISGGYQTDIVLNPDETNPDVSGIGGAETHTPHIVNYQVVNVGNPHIVNTSIPDEAVNDDYVSSDTDPVNPHIVNPHIVNQAVGDIPEGSEAKDATWIISGGGNTTSVINFDTLADQELPDGIESQLLVYRTYHTPTQNGCNLAEEEHHETIINKANPHIVNPHIVNIAPNGSISGFTSQNAADSLLDDVRFPIRPGETIVVKLRLVAPPGKIVAMNEFIDGIHPIPIVRSEALNVVGGVVQLTIDTLSLPNGTVGMPYSTQVEASHGTEPYYWSLGDPPAGWTISSTGVITGPTDAPGTVELTVSVADSSSPSQKASREYSINILPPSNPITLVSPDDGVTDMDNGCDSADELVIWDFDWTPDINATEYHLYVRHVGPPESQNPIIEEIIDSPPTSDESYFHYESVGYIAEINRLNWRWKVRAKILGQWTAWTPERSFDVEPLNTDCAVSELPDYYVSAFSFDIGTVRPREEIGGLIDPVTIRNQDGNDPNIDGVTVGFYISTDSIIDASDRLLVGGREIISNLDSEGSATLSVFSGAQIPYDIAPGEYWLGVLVDDTGSIAETSETNNYLSDGPITVEAPDDELFAIADQDGVPYLYTISVTDNPAQASMVGALGGSVRTYSMAVAPDSLKTIYIWDNSPSETTSPKVRLMAVNSCTGAANAIPDGVIDDATEVSLEALAFDSGGNLYGVEIALDGASRLFSIDTSTGIPTEIGPLGLVDGITVTGMDFADSTLYGLTSDGTKLVTISTTTGAASLLADISSYGIGTPGSLVAVHGTTLLGSSYGANSQIFEINRETGEITKARNLNIDFLLGGLGFSLCFN